MPQCWLSYAGLCFGLSRNNTQIPPLPASFPPAKKNGWKKPTMSPLLGEKEMKNYEFKVRSVKKINCISQKLGFFSPSLALISFQLSASYQPSPSFRPSPPHITSANTSQTPSRCFSSGQDYIKRTTKPALSLPPEKGAFLQGCRPWGAGASKHCCACTDEAREVMHPSPAPPSVPIPILWPNASQCIPILHPDASQFQSFTPMHPHPAL